MSTSGTLRRSFHTSASILLMVSSLFGATTRFKPLQTVTTANGGTTIAAADMNLDGKLDLLVGTAGANSSGGISVLLGNGDGTFQPERAYSTGGHSVTSIAVTDLNGDGKPDVVVSQQEGLAVLLGNGDGTLAAAQLYPISSIDGTSWVTVADVNRDGKPDLIASLECSPNFNDCNHQGAAGVLLGNGDGTFGALHFYGSGGNYPSSVAVADMNGDSILDLVLSNELSTTGYDHGSVGVLLGNGDGTFRTVQTYDKGGFSGGNLAVGDLNHDGIMDVVAANFCRDADCNHSTVSVLLGNGDGSLQAPKLFASGGQNVKSVSLADIDGDGNLDFLVYNACDLNDPYCLQGTVTLSLGKGDGTFLLNQRYNAIANGAGMGLGDVNGDGVPDVLLAGAPGGVLLSLSPTTTLLTSGLNPSAYGQAVVLTATVQSPFGVPSGQVKFKSGTQIVGSATLNADDVATLTKLNLTVASYPFTAVYVGDSNNLGSSSPVVNQVVQQTTSSATIVSSLNPSHQSQSVTFTATVSSPTTIPKGPVTFTAGTVVLGTVQLSGGKARMTTTSLPVGTTKVSVTYEGTSNISGSSASLSQIVQ